MTNSLNYNFVNTSIEHPKGVNNNRVSKCPSATKWIGGTFSSRVSEQCLSACRCTMARLTVPERAREFGGGLPNIAVSTLFYSTPPGLRPTSPIFCYAKSRGGLTGAQT